MGSLIRCVSYVKIIQNNEQFSPWFCQIYNKFQHREKCQFAHCFGIYLQNGLTSANYHAANTDFMQKLRIKQNGHTNFQLTFHQKCCNQELRLCFDIFYVGKMERILLTRTKSEEL